METTIKKFNDASVKILFVLFTFVLTLALAAPTSAVMEQDEKALTGRTKTQTVPSTQSPNIQTAPVQLYKAYEFKDPEIQKIEQALNDVKQFKSSAFAIFNLIQSAVTKMLPLLNACPTLGLGSIGPSLMPLIPPIEPFDKPLPPDGHQTCTYYSESAAQTIRDNASRRYNFFTSLYSQVTSTNTFISNLCPGKGLSSSHKAELLDRLDFFSKYAQQNIGGFDEYTQYLNKILEDYKKCKSTPGK